LFAWSLNLIDLVPNGRTMKTLVIVLSPTPCR
jgi:hypothetical protein